MWIFRPNLITGADIVELFGQLVFTGNYVRGGDSGVIDTVVLPTANASLYRQVSNLKANRPPVMYDLNIAGLFIPNIALQTGATDFKIAIFDTQAAAELANGPYPAGLTLPTNPFHTMYLVYKTL